MRTTAATFPWNAPSGSTVYSHWLRFTTTTVGDGGEGGDGGNRGADGRFGKPGDAASAVLNLGQISGIAAIGDAGSHPRACADQQAAPLHQRAAGLGGFIGTLREKTFSYCYDIALINNPDFTQSAIDNAPPDYRLDLPNNEGRLPSPGRTRARRPRSRCIPRPVDRRWKAVFGILNAGSGKGSVNPVNEYFYTRDINGLVHIIPRN